MHEVIGPGIIFFPVSSHTAREIIAKIRMLYLSNKLYFLKFKYKISVLKGDIGLTGRPGPPGPPGIGEPGLPVCIESWEKVENNMGCFSENKMQNSKLV